MASWVTLGRSLLATKVESSMNGHRVYLLGGGEIVVPLGQPFEHLADEITSILPTVFSEYADKRPSIFAIR